MPRKKKEKEKGTEPTDIPVSQSLDPGRVLLSKEGWTAFMESLSILEQLCTDLVVQQGKVSCLSDGRTSLIQMDFSQLLANEDMYLGSIKFKHQLLRAFKELKGGTMEIQCLPYEYEFMDEVSVAQVVKLNPEASGNATVPPETLERFSKYLEPEPCVQHGFDRTLSDRLSAFQKGLATNTVTLRFHMGKAEFEVRNFGDERKSQKISKGRLFATEVRHGEFPDGTICHFDMSLFQLVDDYRIEIWRMDPISSPSGEARDVICLKILFTVRNLVPVSISVQTYLGKDGKK